MLKTKYPHLEPIALKKYCYAEVEMMEYFDSDRKNVPFTSSRMVNAKNAPGSRPFTIGLGFEWATTVDLGILFNLL